MNIICEHCGKEKMPGHLGQCKKYKKKLNKILTEKYLYENYIILGKSAKEIADCTDISVGTIIRYLKKFGIKTRTVKESINSDRSRERSEQTNLQKYGYKHNFCKEHPSRKEWEKRLWEEEGITNVFQREDVKKKSLKTFIKKYGVEKPSQLQMSRGKNTYSSVHKKVVQILYDMNLTEKDFGIELKLLDNNITRRNKYQSFDIIIFPNRIIEVYGDYWHGNPNLYLPTDIILKGSSREMCVSDKWIMDEKKNKFAINNGYELLIVWESDLNNNLDETVKRIEDFIYEENKNKINKKTRKKKR